MLFLACGKMAFRIKKKLCDFILLHLYWVSLSIALSCSLSLAVWISLKGNWWEFGARFMGYSAHQCDRINRKSSSMLPMMFIDYFLSCTRKKKMIFVLCVVVHVTKSSFYSLRFFFQQIFKVGIANGKRASNLKAKTNDAHTRLPWKNTLCLQPTNNKNKRIN